MREGIAEGIADILITHSAPLLTPLVEGMERSLPPIIRRHSGLVTATALAGGLLAWYMLREEDTPALEQEEKPQRPTWLQRIIDQGSQDWHALAGAVGSGADAVKSTAALVKWVAANDGAGQGR